MTVPTTAPGAAMRREMLEQPAVLSALAERVPTIATELAARGAARRPGLAILARGSSDNAARVAAYSAQVRAGKPVHLVSPSVFTAFEQSASAFGGWLVLAVSQSGQTTEIVTLAERFHAAGALVVGVTNDPGSALADVADVHVSLEAGVETAVPATKTVTAQTLAAVAVASSLGGAPIAPSALDALAGQASSVLADLDGVERIADRIVAAGTVAMTGRAFMAAAAFESALKVQETTGILAHAFSTADFRHGPVRVASANVPVLGFAGSTVADADTSALVEELRGQGRAPMLVGTGSGADVRVPRSEPELEALLAIIRGQQLALLASTSLGLDPDHPAGLSKVTLTV